MDPVAREGIASVAVHRGLVHVGETPGDNDAGHSYGGSVCVGGPVHCSEIPDASWYRITRVSDIGACRLLECKMVYAEFMSSISGTCLTFHLLLATA